MLGFGGGGGMSKYLAGGGGLSPIAPIKENPRKGITLASFVSIIDGVYIIAKSRIKKSTNYIVGENWLYNQCLGSFFMHAIYTVYTGVQRVGKYLIQIKIILVMPDLD